MYWQNFISVYMGLTPKPCHYFAFKTWYFFLSILNDLCIYCKVSFWHRILTLCHSWHQINWNALGDSQCHILISVLNKPAELLGSPMYCIGWKIDFYPRKFCVFFLEIWCTIIVVFFWQLYHLSHHKYIKIILNWYYFHFFDFISLIIRHLMLIEPLVCHCI